MAAFNDVMSVMSSMGVLAPIQVLIVVSIVIYLFKSWTSRS